jgi:hypothetical protein
MTAAVGTGRDFANQRNPHDRAGGNDICYHSCRRVIGTGTGDMAESSAPQGESALAGLLERRFRLTGRHAEAKPAVIILAVLFATKFAVPN